MTSSFPHTHPPIYRFFSLAIAKLVYNESSWPYYTEKIAHKKVTNNFFSLHIFWSRYHLVTPTPPPLWWRNTWTVPCQNTQARYILFLTHFEICRLVKSFYSFSPSLLNDCLVGNS
jgi:hypothetical protein